MRGANHRFGLRGDGQGWQGLRAYVDLSLLARRANGQSKLRINGPKGRAGVSQAVAGLKCKTGTANPFWL